LTVATSRPVADARALEGVAVVLDELYRAFFVRLVRRASWRYGLSKEDAREVVHDAFLLALVKLNTKGNPRAWIYSVVDRLAANWQRKAIRRSQLMEKWHPSECRPDQGQVLQNDEDAGFSLGFEEGEP
jgi:DNA-directed RNA polymerase specialized sigma24 family protein